ncbi:MAG TPA: hypothetical protein VGH86_03445 [Phenylobacterium sp.]|jgi:hypothetical protein
MSNDGDYVVERTIEGPTTIRREEVRVVRERGSAGWWVAAIVAIMAIVGVIFMLNGGLPADLRAVSDQRTAQAQVDSAATGAQMAAAQAAQSAQAAADSNARAASNAAQAAVDRTVATSRDAAAELQERRDASSGEATPPAPQ